MARHLFVTWAGGGNVNPFLGLAEHLLGRGHHLGAVAPASLHDRLAAAGVEPVSAPPGWLPDAAHVVAGAAAYRPDVVVVDYMLTGALSGAEKVGRPTVALVHTLYRALLRDSAPSPMEMAGSVAAVNEARAALSLAPVTGYAGLLDAVDLVLVAAPQALDTPGEVPAHVVYAGALFEGPGPDAGWEPPAGEGPLVVVSMGTAGDPAIETPVLRTVLAALAGLPVRGFLTLPDPFDRTVLDVPTNVTVSGYVRHAAVMPHADAVVTHAGLGTIAVALGCGVPIVALPLDRDQPDNARAVARAGAGVALAPDTGIDDLRAAIAAQLDRPDPVRMAPDPGPALTRVEALAGG